MLALLHTYRNYFLQNDTKTLIVHCYLVSAVSFVLLFHISACFSDFSHSRTHTVIPIICMHLCQISSQSVFTGRFPFLVDVNSVRALTANLWRFTDVMWQFLPAFSFFRRTWVIQFPCFFLHLFQKTTYGDISGTGIFIGQI